MDVIVVRGTIAAESADALVNAAGTSLRMGGGVAGALLDAANGPLEEAAAAQGPIDLGGVAVTDAYDLDADYVIHAAAMSHGGPHRLATPESIRTATRNALERADGLGCESVVVPLLGCGSGGVYTPEGARIVCEEIHGFGPRDLEDVRVIAYSEREYEILEATVEELGE